MPTIRSFLFVPASRMDRVEKALATQADAIIIDLEDAVALAEKDRARQDLDAWLSHQKNLERIWVRINPLQTELGHTDINLLGRHSVAGWVLPKAENMTDISVLQQKKAMTSQIALLIESAIGVANARQLASQTDVSRLMFGTIDFQLDLNMKCDELETQLNTFRLELTLASTLAGIYPPVDGVTVSTSDEQLLQNSVQQAQQHGFSAKLCIHPNQVATVNQGFMPSAQEYDWAKRVIEGDQTHQGAAFAVDGKMVDKPVIELAKRIINQYER